MPSDSRLEAEKVWTNPSIQALLISVVNKMKAVLDVAAQQSHKLNRKGCNLRNGWDAGDPETGAVYLSRPVSREHAVGGMCVRGWSTPLSDQGLLPDAVITTRFWCAWETLWDTGINPRRLDARQMPYRTITGRITCFSWRWTVLHPRHTQFPE